MATKRNSGSGFLEAVALVPGAVATGAVREVISGKINGTWKSLPVAKEAYVMDGIGVLLGGALQALGMYMDQPVLTNVGAGIMVPSLTYLSQNGTHDTIRKFSKGTPPTALAPQRVMYAQEVPQLAAAAPAPVFRPALTEDF